MENDKETGSYYTPHNLINFMNRYLQRNSQSFANVLEPSAGDGRFLSVLLPQSGCVKAIELFKEKVEDILDRYECTNLVVEQNDFLDYAMKSNEKYSLIIGNPPYINPKVMGKDSVKKAKLLCEAEGIDAAIMQNMWTAFVVGACRLLQRDGTIFFVLPMEFLQVQYAEKLRAYLEKSFNVIHIISFQESIFTDIEQDVCLVYLSNRTQGDPYILYEIYEDTINDKLLFENTIKKNKPLKKWSNAILTDGEILLLKRKEKRYTAIDDMGVTAPGIVTGGNKYFIITEEKVKEYACQEFVLPILQKCSFMPENTIIMGDDLIKELNLKKKPSYLLNLIKVKEEELPRKLKAYLDWAKEQKVGNIELGKCFKCANRKPWYGVPIVKKGDVVFFKRYHFSPRVYVNNADIHTTDAGYHIRLKSEWEKESLVFCFYNSLTLAQCEFHGRYYGGGVSELVPSEFKELKIPYRKIEAKDIEVLDQMFKDKKDLDSIVKYVNARTISLDMEADAVEKIEAIRKKLIRRRCKELG